MQKNLNNIYVISDGGLGYGIGKISAKNSPAFLKAKALEFLCNNEGAFVSVAEGDGCGDGRICCDEDSDKPPRAKMFGCGLMMHVAIKISQGEYTETANSQLKESFKALNKEAENRDFCFGAHTDDHIDNNKCGCGAMDNFVSILDSAVEYRKQHEQALVTLLANKYNSNVYDEVSNVFKDARNNYKGEYSSKAISDEMINYGVDVRKLKGKHQEIDIVLNTVFGTTLDQKAYWRATDYQAQAFCVDLWRINQYADIFANSDKGAVYGMLLYTLATAATLTDGTLRLIIRKD